MLHVEPLLLRIFNHFVTPTRKPSVPSNRRYQLQHQSNTQAFFRLTYSLLVGEGEGRLSQNEPSQKLFLFRKICRHCTDCERLAGSDPIFNSHDSKKYVSLLPLAPHPSTIEPPAKKICANSLSWLTWHKASIYHNHGLHQVNKANKASFIQHKRLQTNY